MKKIQIRKNLRPFVLIIIFILPHISACSVVMFSTMGTNYDKKMNQDTSRDELHRLFGQPVAAWTFSTPLYPRDIPAVRVCFHNFDKSAQQRKEIVGEEITGFEVFKIKGVVRTYHASEAVLCLLGDLATLGFAEIVFTPYATSIWIDGSVAEKSLTVWYGINNRFLVGKIESDTHQVITFIPRDCHDYFSKQPETQTTIPTTPREER